MSDETPYRRPLERRAFVADTLASIGLTIGQPDKLPSMREAELAAMIGPRLPDWWSYRHEMMWTGSLYVSAYLADKMGSRVRAFEPEVPAMPPIDDDLAGYDEMRRE